MNLHAPSNFNPQLTDTMRRKRGTPSRSVTGFEDSLSDEACGLRCQPLEVGLASEARSKTEHWRSRKDDDENENAAPGEP